MQNHVVYGGRGEVVESRRVQIRRHLSRQLSGVCCLQCLQGQATLVYLQSLPSNLHQLYTCHSGIIYMFVYTQWTATPLAANSHVSHRPRWKSPSAQNTNVGTLSQLMYMYIQHHSLSMYMCVVLVLTCEIQSTINVIIVGLQISYNGPYWSSFIHTLTCIHVHRTATTVATHITITCMQRMFFSPPTFSWRPKLLRYMYKWCALAVV